MIRDFLNFIFYLPATIIVGMVFVVLTYTMDRDNLNMVVDFVKATQQAITHLYDIFSFVVWVVVLIVFCT